MALVLHGYWRSSAAYRVRIGLNLNGLAFRQATLDLRSGDQRAAAYRELAPIGLVPTLEADGLRVTQSLAILEWLEDTPQRPGNRSGAVDALCCVPLLGARLLARKAPRAL
jgi:maleylpyruvate isomerase